MTLLLYLTVLYMTQMPQAQHLCQLMYLTPITFAMLCRSQLFRRDLVTLHNRP